VRPEAVDAPGADAADYGPGDFARDTGASPEAMADMERFLARLSEANRDMNLVGPSALPEFWLRHALDSAQLLRLAPEARVWADLGAGAGFPGLVLAILLKGRPNARVHLIDSLAKRCRFLAQLVDELALPAEVHNARAEDLSLAVEVVTARACAPLSRLLGFAEPYFRRGAEGLFLKGERAEAELHEAAKSWRFEQDLLPSLSDPRGRVVRIRRLRRAR
jgi:16S rRNA (guanine527-N7)-methyltransferase